MLFTREQTQEFEAAMTPRQIKVVNFFVGKSMGECKKNKVNPDPQVIRQMVIEKLVLETYEESDDEVA